MPSNIAGQVNDVQRLLRKIVPALRYDSEHHRANRLALIHQCRTFIHETGDGEFSLILSNALELLPEVRAHMEHVIEVDCLFATESFEFSVARNRRVLRRVFHENPQLFEAVKNMATTDGKPSGSK